MKKNIVILVIFLTVNMNFLAYADYWYVVNKENKVIVKCDYEPDKDDLTSREEFAVKSKKDIPLQKAEYRAGEIIEHIMIPQALKLEQQKQLQLETERKIQEEMQRILRERAIANLKARQEIE